MFLKGLTACFLASAIGLGPATLHIVHWASHLGPSEHSHVHHDHAEEHRHAHESEDHHTVPSWEQIPAVIKSSMRMFSVFGEQPIVSSPIILPAGNMFAGHAESARANAPPGMSAIPELYLSLHPIHGPPSI